MKLSKAQQAVMENAKNRIDFARTHSFDEWHLKHFRNTIDEYKQRNGENSEAHKSHIDYVTKRYEEERRGITLAHCNSKTLYKLREYGMIEIVEDSKGETYGIDVIKVLNY